MIRQLPQKFSVQPIIDQVNALGDFGKRLDINDQTGEFFGDPWSIKPEFKNTPLGDVLSVLGNVGQARLLCLESAESYTAHCDPDDRIHLAIHTNPYSFLVDLSDNKMYHLKADGQLWYMNTGKVHVAANWGSRARVHLNIRVLLPKYSSSRAGLRIKVLDGEFDWKQMSYMPIMEVVNKEVKTGTITGFKGISEKEILVNTDNVNIFDSAFNNIKNAGVNLEISYV
jgi:hypothetical protein